jgi:hypothetical protein
MDLNLKQQELVADFIARIQQQFPTAEFQYITPSAEDSRDVWIHFLVHDDDESLALGSFAAELSIEMLIHYGYSLAVIVHTTELAI